MSLKDRTMYPAGDDKGHQVGLAQMEGEALFEDGRKGKYSNVVYFDLQTGKSLTYLGYTKITFEEDSWFY